MSEALRNQLVVTAHAPDGTAIIVSDDAIAEFELAGRSVRSSFLWGRDDTASFPDDGILPPAGALVPPPGGCRFSTLTIAAGATGDYHALITSLLASHADAAEPGFHRTPTLDFITVVEGSFTLEVDRGARRVMQKGDCAVLNGVRHRWHNEGQAEAKLVAVSIGARDRRG